MLIVICASTKMSDVLKNFHSEFDHGIGKPFYVCKYCDLKYTHHNVTKIKKHLGSKCKKCPRSVSSTMASKFFAATSNSQKSKSTSQTGQSSGKIFSFIKEKNVSQSSFNVL